MPLTSSARSAAALVTQRSRSVRYSVAMLAVKSRMYSKSSSEVRFISSARKGSGTSVAAASSRAGASTTSWTPTTTTGSGAVAGRHPAGTTTTGAGLRAATTARTEPLTSRPERSPPVRPRTRTSA